MELKRKLRGTSAKAGKGKPIGIGTGFWLELRWEWARENMLEKLHPETRLAFLKKRRIGEWEGHTLMIIPGSMNNDSLNDPRPWKEVQR